MTSNYLGIGIHGKKFSGKSEVSRLLKKKIWDWSRKIEPLNHLAYLSIHELAFASRVKYIANAMVPWIPKSYFLESNLKEKKLDRESNLVHQKFFQDFPGFNLDKCARDLMKLVGEEGRKIHEDLWVVHILMEIYFRLREPRYYLSDQYNPLPRESIDSDFDVSKIHSIFLIDDVRRQNEYQALREREFLILRVVRENQTSSDDHPTETELDHLTDDAFDGVIFNSTLEHLEKQIDDWFELVIKKKLEKLIGIA